MNGSWTYKGGDGEGTGSSGVAGQEDVEVPNLAVAQMLTFESEALREEPMSNFERLMIGRLDTMTDEQRRHHEYCVTHFQQLHRQVDDIHETLNNLNL